MTTAQTRAQTITTTVGGTFNLPNNTVPGTPTVFDGHTATQNENVFAGIGPFTIKLGTGHTNHVTFSGGNSGASSVTGLGGNDTVTMTGGAHGTYTLNLGNGDNTIALDNAFGTVAYTTTNGGAYDTLDASQITTAVTASLLATTTAFATTGGAIADIHTMHGLILGSGAATVTLNNLDDQVTFGTGAATVTGGTGNDSYIFKNFTGGASVSHTITDNGGINNLDFSATTGNVSVNFSGGGNGTAYVTGTGAGLGFQETINYSGSAGHGINDVLGGMGTDTFSLGNTAGTHSINGGIGGASTLVYTGSQGVTLDARDHDLINGAGTTNVTFHGIQTFKVLGAGSNTIIGDGNGETYYVGNGTNNIDTTGGATTVHSDMGGHTTVVVGDTYGATTVTNTNANGVLTVDASGLSHALTTCTLGAGSGAAGIDDGHGTTVVWGASSNVTGLIGNDQATTVATAGGSANLNYNIALGNGVDSVTLGNGNNSVSMGSGAGDAIVVGTGSNTVILGNGAGDTVTAGNGNNYLYLGGGSGATEGVGNGNNVIDFSNGGTHTITIGGATGTDNNTYQGFSQNNNWNVTIASTAHQTAGANDGTTTDTLDLSNYASTQVTWSDPLNGGGHTQNLVLTFDANHVVTIDNYFDGGHATAATSTIGTGEIHTIHFSDLNFNLAAVKAIPVAGGFV